MFITFTSIILIALMFIGREFDARISAPIRIENMHLRIWWMLAGIFSLSMLIPFLAVSARRLHDSNKSGWVQLLLLLPVVGWIILLVFYCQESYSTDNRWGLNPTRISYGDGRPIPKSLGRRRRR